MRRVRKRQRGLRRLTPAINAAALAQPNTGSGQKTQRHKEWSKDTKTNTESGQRHKKRSDQRHIYKYMEAS